MPKNSVLRGARASVASVRVALLITTGARPMRRLEFKCRACFGTIPARFPLFETPSAARQEQAESFFGCTMNHSPMDPLTYAVGLGASVHESGVTFRTWAPDHAAVSVRIRRPDGAERKFPLERADDGYFLGYDPAGAARDHYVFVLADGSAVPDPASRFQPDGVHGWSECVDPREYRWQTHDWHRPLWCGQSIYEFHVGTFTRKGTFRAAIDRLEHVAALGVEAIELMPVADFPGERNWGYDGVALFAPARCYGRPDDLRALIDAAHSRGLAVILDVVYNHLGPDGNYLARFADGYFAKDRHTPWGQSFNLSGPGSRPVRDFFLTNVAYWLDEFRVDGLRLDATHAIDDESPQHLLTEIAEVAHARGAFVIAEDERNTCEILRRPDGTGSHIDAVWADDFHHQVRVALTGSQESYFSSFNGSPSELARTIEQGWFYVGQPFSQWRGRPRGESCVHLPTSALVYCIENHDQVGNRAQGERLEHLIGVAAFRAASALLCLCPYPPLIFMGQEWAASTPFLFFSDHAGELGKMISAGRQREFAKAGLNQGIKPEDVPDPQLLETFEESKLNWDELRQFPHGSVLALYRECLRQRLTWLRGAATERQNWSVITLRRALAIRYEMPGEPARLLVCSLQGDTRIGLTSDARLASPGGTVWQVQLDSRPVAASAARTALAVDALTFEQPATVLLIARKSTLPA